MFNQSEMDKAIAHAKANPIQSRGRTSISRMAAHITNGITTYEGWNKYKTHPIMYRFSQDHNKICLHAEIDAIIQVIKETGNFFGLSSYDCYVARVLKNGSPALAKPCDTCLGALTYYGIRKIYYTTSNGYGEI